MSDSQPNNPPHGVTLAMMLDQLVDRYGWEKLGRRINIKCFTHEPSIKSSLKFLHCRIPTGFTPGSLRAPSGTSSCYSGRIQHLLNLLSQVLVAQTPWAREKVEALYLRSLEN